MLAEEKYILAELACLRDAVVTDVIAEGHAPGEVYPVLVFLCRDGKTRGLVIERDPEGNGPGFARVQVIS